jgi:murein DD-endopeptidase MepM/ murein hydrolase activator NlpD
MTRVHRSAIPAVLAVAWLLGPGSVSRPAAFALTRSLAPAPGQPDGRRIPAVHVVRSGESLWDIALARGVSVRSLRDANGLAGAAEPRAGSVLRVPDESPLDRWGARLSGEVPATGGRAREVVIAYPDSRANADAAQDRDRDQDQDADEDEVPGQLVAGRRRAPYEPGATRTLDWPVDGTVLSGFGRRRRRGRRHHDGIDIKARRGTPIGAARRGAVLFAGAVRGHGRAVVLDHEDGTCTVYSHNQQNLVTGGERVAAGQPIATVGSSGNASTPHVHFEVREDGRPVDPAPLLRPRMDR